MGHECNAVGLVLSFCQVRSDPVHSLSRSGEATSTDTYPARLGLSALLGSGKYLLRLSMYGQALGSHCCLPSDKACIHHVMGLVAFWHFHTITVGRTVKPVQFGKVVACAC